MSQVGFSDASETSSDCHCTLESTDTSVTVTETTTGFDITVEQKDLCELVAAAADNGLVIGG